MTIIWILLALLLVLILWTQLEQRILTSKKYTIESNTVGKDLHGLSFLLLSDIHNKSFGKNNRRLIKRIIEQKPDFVIIAGDMVVKRKPCYPGKAYSLIKEISEHYTIYYAYGNHEQYFEDLALKDAENIKQRSLYESWCLYKEKLNELGVFLLDNNNVMLKYKENSIDIAGLSISMDFYENSKIALNKKDEITSKIGKRSKEGYQILIAHNPIYFSDYVHWGADLVLSGHIHGGLIRIPFLGGLISPQVKLFPKYDAGLFEEDSCRMVVSRGLGNHSIMPRILNPPELVHIKLLTKAD